VSAVEQDAAEEEEAVVQKTGQLQQQADALLSLGRVG
jgi:hypothetical protein